MVFKRLFVFCGEWYYQKHIAICLSPPRNGLLCKTHGWHEGQTVGCVVEFHTGFAMGPIRQASCVRNDPEQGAGAEVVSAFQGAVPLCDGLS